MMRVSRVFSVLLLLAFVFALAIPNNSVVARKMVFKAVMTTDAELHEVVGSNARGSAVIGHAPDGTFNFMVQVRGLSGPATAMHIHGPATEAENAGVILTFCGAPAPAAGGPCVTDADGNLTVSGNFNSTFLLGGVTGAQFQSWLTSGLLYVNVHTALNPAGEARGQLYQQ
jgi:hypothetical protein